MNGNKIEPATGIVCAFPTLPALIDTLNDVLLGEEENGLRPYDKSVSMWHLDTATYDRNLMGGRYYDMRQPVTLEYSPLCDALSLYIPVGLGFHVRTQPLEVHATKYYSEVRIGGDHIAIRTSYVDPVRHVVFDRHYGITARERR